MSLIDDRNIKALFKEEFELSVLKSAYSRIHDYNDPLRGPIFALLMRELIRISMNRMAPDEEVIKASWCHGEPWMYEELQSKKEKLTRKGRYRFAITGTISDAKIQTYPGLDCSQAIEDMNSLVGKLSKFAHISPGTYNLSATASLEFLHEVESIVLDYAKKFVETKEQIGGIILELVRSKLDEHLMEEIPHELDELSSGTRLDAVHVDNLQDFDTSSTFPVLSGSGYAEVELNYGGGSDGFSSDDSYPFEFHVQIDPDTFEIEIQSVNVDTAEFYGQDEDDLEGEKDEYRAV